MEPQGRIECEFDLVVNYDRPLAECLAGYDTVSPIIQQNGCGAAYQDEGRGTVTHRACLVHFEGRVPTEAALCYPYPRILVPAGPLALVACDESLGEMSPPYPIVELKSLLASPSYNGNGTLFIQRRSHKRSHGARPALREGRGPWRSLNVTWGRPAWAVGVRFLFFIADPA